MKWITHPVMTALSLTNLLLLFMTARLTSASHYHLYHWSGPVSSILTPVLIVFAAMWLLLWFLLLAGRRRRWLELALWTGVVLSLPLAFSKTWSGEGNAVPLWPEVVIFCAVAVALTVGLTRYHSSFFFHFRQVRRVLTIVAGFGALGGVLTLGQLLLVGWNCRALNSPLPLHEPEQEGRRRAARTRVVWVIFDELSYEQMFERRFPGLDLPAFDQLREVATNFTHVVPAGGGTDNAIPTMLTGRMVGFSNASTDGRTLFIKDLSSGEVRRFDPQDTVFEDALRRGYSTAVSGWHVPYCRIASGVLDRCFWTCNWGLIVGNAPYLSVGENLKGFASRMLTSAISLKKKLLHEPDFNIGGAEGHRLDFEEIIAVGNEDLKDPLRDFVLLHLPVPHPGGIYDRANGLLDASHSTYIDNMALADKAMGHIRSVLEESGMWDSSAVVVMGDHSWRTSYLWALRQDWTKEEAAASRGGRFDERPGYILKLPGQRVGTTIDTRFGAVYTRVLLDGVMDGRIRTPEELAVWVKAQPYVASPVNPK